MHLNTSVAAVVIALLALTALGGCLDGEEGTAAKTSLTEIRVADMPTEDFLHVNVSFSEIRLHSNETGWQTIEAGATVDLLYLHEHNLSEQLGIEDIPVANYTRLWLLVDNATGVLADTNETVVFDVPSGTLKIQHLFALQQGNNSITLDIDLERSLFARGDMYKLLPVISGLNVSYANGTQIHIRDRDRIRRMTPNRPPVVDLVVNGSRGRHLNAAVNESVTFDASGSFDLDNDSLTFAWDFDDGGTATGPTVEHSFTETGAYRVTMTVSDGAYTRTGHVTVTVGRPGGPGHGDGSAFTVDVLVNGAAVQHLNAGVDESIAFNASGDFDRNDENVTVDWDFDEGASATGPMVEHSFNERGAYRVTVTVSDGAYSYVDAVTITVKEPGGNGPGGP